MRMRILTLTMLVLLGGLPTAPPAHARAQLGDLLKKVTGKDSKAKETDKDKAPSKDTAKSNEGTAGSAESAGNRAPGPAPKQERKVDSFIDQNNDGVDDRRQSKVRRDSPRKASPESSAATRRPASRSVPDSSKTRPPR